MKNVFEGVHKEAASNAQDSSLSKLLSIPFIDQVSGSSDANRIVFSVNEEGRRNVYLAEGEKYSIRKLTAFDKDDAQEISSLSISVDGKWAVFARGGDHGANSAPVPTNSASLVTKASIDVYTINLDSGKVYRIGAGDFPIFNKGNNAITFLRSYQVWSAPLDKEDAARPLFSMRGSAGNISWSPDGSKLAFISRRGSYSFVGIYDSQQERIQWVSPSFHRDSSPRWSPDGTKLAFVRRHATGGALDSLTVRRYDPWSIIVHDLLSNEDFTLYQSADTEQAYYPIISGQANLRWNHPEYITFMSYEDGWPHLYKVSTMSKHVSQLTKGNFAVTDVSASSDGSKILFSANTGDSAADTDRSHIGMVDVASGAFSMLTTGEGIESKPSFFNGGQMAVWKSSSYNTPVQPQVYEFQTKKKVDIANELMSFLKSDDFVRPKQVWITSKDGLKFSAQLFRPAKGKANKAGLVYIHGGPRRQMLLGWHHIDYYFYDYAFNQYLASQGYTVLSVNFRLGTGYGYDFQHAKSGSRFGASEYQDIVASGEWLQNHPDVDPEKIGVFGGSYGGFLTAMALGRNSDLFKAGVDIHGMHNRMLKQNLEFYPPDFDLATKLSWDSSPSKYVDTWTSPVLLIHGDHDQNVPFEQSIDIYNRLIRKGVEVEALVLPDENHHWQLHENLIKVKASTAVFLDKHLLGE